MTNIVFDPLSVVTLFLQMVGLTFIALVIYKLIMRIWYEV